MSKHTNLGTHLHCVNYWLWLVCNERLMTEDVNSLPATVMLKVITSGVFNINYAGS